MSKFLRISNRGLCPRGYLLIFGATTKREAFADPSQGGWFGSGTKFAPVAAKALGIDVHFTSTDANGPYRFTYGVSCIPGEKGDIDMIVLRFPNGQESMTMLSTQSGMNWSDPIGDDTMRSYRVLREYLRNAKDEDANGPYLHWVGDVHDARQGATEVFLTANDEIRHMMEHADRYFKYVSKTAPFCIVDDYGAVFPKSEEGVTRMFSLIDASLAYCSKDANDSSLFDYTFFDKKLMTEERVFGNMTHVYHALGNMLSRVDNVVLLEQLIFAMVQGDAATELRALSYISKPAQITCREAWVEAWKSVYGQNAIIATGNVEEDRLAVAVGKKKPVTVQSDVLRKFFTLCGITNSRAHIPLVSDPGYEVVEPDDFERRRLRKILDTIYKEYPEVKDIPVHVFTHTDEKWNISGIAMSHDGNPPYTDVYIHQLRLRGSSAGTVKTLLHEFTHVISGDAHGTPFIVVDDWQRALLFMNKYRIPQEGVKPHDLIQYEQYLEETQLRASGLSEADIAVKRVLKMSKQAAAKQGGE